MEGQTAGGGVFAWPANSPGRSVFAVDGGFPVSFAGASAHQTPGPRKSLTATRPCEVSCSEEEPIPLVVILSARVVTDRTGPAPGTREVRKPQPLGLVLG